MICFKTDTIQVGGKEAHHACQACDQSFLSLILTAISRQADIEMPVPSICFRAYSERSLLWTNQKFVISMGSYLMKNLVYHKKRPTRFSLNWFRVHDVHVKILPILGLRLVNMPVRSSAHLAALKLKEILHLGTLCARLDLELVIHPCCWDSSVFWN